MDYLTSYTQQLQQYLNVNQQIAAGIGGFLAAIMLVLLAHVFNFWYANRVQKQIKNIREITRQRYLSTPEQENVEKVLISNAVTTGIEHLVRRGKIIPERGVIWSRRLANLLNLPDLMAKHEALLKRRLRTRFKASNVIQLPVKVAEGMFAQARQRVKRRSKA